MKTGICDICVETFPYDDLHSVGRHVLCEDCYSNNTLICSRCGEPLLSDENAGTDSFALCLSCRNEAYTQCCECDELLRLDQAYYTEEDTDRPLCYDCYCDTSSKNKWIEQYSFKPRSIFYGQGPRYFGVELEIDLGGYSNTNAKQLLEIANRDHEYLYAKSDSSIEDGFELVSHPCSLDQHMKDVPWKDVLDMAVKLGYVSHKASSCGLHVHVSRLSLGANTSAQQNSVSHLIYMFEKFWDQILIFSRRTQAQMDRWSRRYGLHNDVKKTFEDAKQMPNGRYSSINLLCPETIEFRGSLVYSTLISALQFADAICDAAVYLSDEEVEQLSWQQFVINLDPVKRKELIEYLKKRRLFVNSVTECEEAEI